MNRREFLQCAAVVAANASVVPQGWAFTNEQRAFLATQANYVDSKRLNFFNSNQRAVVKAIAEQIIPKTDTPGAIDAGVPRFIELMVADWFNDEERKHFIRGLSDLNARSDQSFEYLTSIQQLEVLELLEEQASDASWYTLGNVFRIWDSEAPFICQFKELTVLGFFFSEQGATQVLRINPMGTFKGDIPLSPEEASYAAELPTRLLV